MESVEVPRLTIYSTVESVEQKGESYCMSLVDMGVRIWYKGPSWLAPGDRVKITIIKESGDAKSS